MPDGDWVESGLHVFCRAYRETFALIREVGIYDKILWKDHALKYTMAGRASSFAPGPRSDRCQRSSPTRLSRLPES
jgi:uncharacterized protein with NAD-binding domain and iron-sulfur cluster